MSATRKKTEKIKIQISQERGFFHSEVTSSTEKYLYFNFHRKERSFFKIIYPILKYWTIDMMGKCEMKFESDKIVLTLEKKREV